MPRNPLIFFKNKELELRKDMKFIKKTATN